MHFDFLIIALFYISGAECYLSFQLKHFNFYKDVQLKFSGKKWDEFMSNDLDSYAV